MKFIFICLLVINAVLFALWGGYFDHRNVTSGQSQRLLQQQNSAQLKLVSAQVATAPPAVSPVVIEADPEPVSCLVWGTFQGSELDKVESRLKLLSFKNPPERQPIQATNSTIVFIPSLGSKAAAEKKVAELTQLGVKDFYIVHNQSGANWGISLGVFKSAEAAKQLLATLTSKGVQNVRMKDYVLPGAAAKNKFKYVFNNLSSAEQASLENLKDVFPAQELRVCK